MTHLEAEQQEELLQSFLKMVRAKDGDFEVLGELGAATSDPGSLDQVIVELMKSAQSQQALEQKMQIGPVDFDLLAQMPEDSLGYQYYRHLFVNDLKPLTPTHCQTDYQYLNFHLSETHDIWHVVTGSNTDVLGELQLEAFYVAQLKYSRFWLALLIKNLLKATVYNIDQATTYMEYAMRGWQMGGIAKPLFGVPWHTLWDTSLEQVRHSLHISVEMDERLGL